MRVLARFDYLPYRCNPVNNTKLKCSRNKLSGRNLTAVAAHRSKLAGCGTVGRGRAYLVTNENVKFLENGREHLQK